MKTYNVKKKETPEKFDYDESVTRILQIKRCHDAHAEIVGLYDEYFRIRGQIKKARNALKVLVVTGAAYAGFLTFVLIKTI